MMILSGNMASRIFLLWLTAMMGQSIFAVGEELPDSLQTHDLSPLFNSLDESPQKRAYTYVSEYKRLPVYNFGIGKRWADDDKRWRQYSIGLGKRTQRYNFGLGKRSERQDYSPIGSMDYAGIDSVEGLHPREEGLGDFLEEKRGRQPYSFGLGKRGWNYAAAAELPVAGKRPNDMTYQRYHFGLGKRMAEDDESMQ